MPVSATQPSSQPLAPLEPVAPSSSLPDRLAAAGGIGFALLLVLQNVLRSTEPLGDASPSRVIAWFQHHHAATLIPVSVFPLGMLLLLMFTAGVREHGSHAGGTAPWWGRVAGGAVMAIVSLFALVNVLDIALAAYVHRGPTSTAVVAGLWLVHAAAFALNVGAIGIALLGFGETASTCGIIPRRMRLLTRTGAVCLFLPSLAATGIVDGSHILGLALVGFLCWMVFVVTAGVGLWRSAGRQVAS